MMFLGVGVTLLLLVGTTIPSTHGYAESIYHEEVLKQDVGSNAFHPTFLTDSPNKLIYPTPKHCLRREFHQKRRKHAKPKGGKTSQNVYVSSWMDFMNYFYWDNGMEYTKWTHSSEGLTPSDKEPWHMVPSGIIPILLYLLVMIFTGIVAPLISIIMVRTFHWIWMCISSNRTRNFIRRLWTMKEVWRRKLVLSQYHDWAEIEDIPIIRAQLPWLLRRYEDEELPIEMMDLILYTSTEESSIGENSDDYYDGTEGYEKVGTDDECTQRQLKEKDKDGKIRVPHWRKRFRKMLSDNEKKFRRTEETELVKERKKRRDKREGRARTKKILGGGFPPTRSSSGEKDFHV